MYRQEVNRIEMQGGRAVAVHTHRGGRWEADAVVANLTPWNLESLLTDAKPSAHAAVHPGAMWGAFMLYLGVEAEAIPADLACDHHQIIMDPTRPLGEGNSVFVSLSPAWDSTRAPAGKRAITVSTHTAIAPWWELRNNPGGQAYYEARQQDYRERLLQAVARVLPTIRQHLALEMPGTPVTFQKFTRRHLGMVGGFAQHSLLNARGPATRVPNVWLVGDSIFPGQSTAGVTLGGLLSLIHI